MLEKPIEFAAKRPIRTTKVKEDIAEKRFRELRLNKKLEKIKQEIQITKEKLSQLEQDLSAFELQKEELKNN